MMVEDHHPWPGIQVKSVGNIVLIVLVISSHHFTRLFPINFHSCKLASFPGFLIFSTNTRKEWELGMQNHVSDVTSKVEQYNNYRVTAS